MKVHDEYCPVGQATHVAEAVAACEYFPAAHAVHDSEPAAE
jgi:hypothetical protein